MDLREAFAYSKENYKSLSETKSMILGIAYTPKDSDADFYFAEISFDEETKLEEGTDFYNVLLEGGKVLSSEGVEDCLGGEDIESFIEELPDYLKNIQYHVYQGKSNYSGYETSHALRILFPNLPDAENVGAAKFKAAAIPLVNKLNNH